MDVLEHLVVGVEFVGFSFVSPAVHSFRFLLVAAVPLDAEGNGDDEDGHFAEAPGDGAGEALVGEAVV